MPVPDELAHTYRRTQGRPRAGRRSASWHVVRTWPYRRFRSVAVFTARRRPSSRARGMGDQSRPAGLSSKSKLQGPSSMIARASSLRLVGSVAAVLCVVLVAFPSPASAAAPILARNLGCGK